MTKTGIHQRFIDQLTRELASMTAAAKSSIAMATDKEHQARSKYETFSLESSYLARGQAKRVSALSDALERLQQLPMRTLDETTPVQLGAWVRLEADNGERRALFFGPGGGGERVTVDGEEIVMVTSQSPMGQAVLGRVVGECFELKSGVDTRTFTVVSVE